MAWATLLALAFPVIFFTANGAHPHGRYFTSSSIGLLAIASCTHSLTTGVIFPRISARTVTLIMYIWGFLLISIAGALIYSTGGLGSSVFVWLFEFALVVALLVSPRAETTFLRRWRPALFTIALQAVMIATLMVAGGHRQGAATMDALHMDAWGAGSLIVALSVTALMFWISAFRLEKEQP